jgi:hypothetical protein
LNIAEGSNKLSDIEFSKYLNNSETSLKLGTPPIFLKGVNNATEKKKKWSRLRYEDF